MKKALEILHKNYFSKTPTNFYFAPGRVNLIGEHIDYVGGHVLPIALPMGITASVSSRMDHKIRIVSDSDPHHNIEEFVLENCDYNPKDSYVKYIKGMCYKILLEGYRITQGIDIYIKSDLPIGAGLSSSATLMMLAGFIISDQNNLNIELRWLVRYARYVENSYLGLQSGIMDQYVIAYGLEDTALFINTKKSTHEEIPFKLEHHTLLVMHTNKTRNLNDTDYNERVHSVETATKHFRNIRGIEYLCDLDIKGFNQLRQSLTDPVVLKRAEHVIYEHARTLDAVKALRANDMVSFGELMVQSHDSLKYLYEVSCDELDYLVESNLSLGALGARMTGAGFGGSMIALYDNNVLPQNFDTLKSNYEKRFKRTLDIYPITAKAGVRKLK